MRRGVCRDVLASFPHLRGAAHPHMACASLLFRQLSPLEPVVFPSQEGSDRSIAATLGDRRVFPATSPNLAYT
jgi:hypothetical protein